MIAPITLDLDGMTFNESTDEWVFTDWSGWLGGAPMSVRLTQRSGHGASASRGRRSERVLWVQGWRAGNRESLAHEVENLESLLADGTVGILRVFDETLGERWAKVQLTGTIDTDWSNPRWLEFQINLVAPDPFKYGDTVQASTGFGSVAQGVGFVWPAFPDGDAEWGDLGSQGTVTLTNEGKAPSTVRFIVDGPSPEGGFQIVTAETGRRIEFRSVVPAGSQLVIDGATGNATLDGVADRSGDLVVDAWPVLQPGVETTFTFDPLAESSAATLTAETTATYW